MCEAIIKQSPGYFKQFAKNTRYFVTDKYPSLHDDDQFAFAFHGSGTTSCTLPDFPHWHVMLYNAKQSIGYPVQCPYSCFALLIVNGANFQYNGDLFYKLLNATIYNEKYPSEDVNISKLNTKLHVVTTTFKQDMGTQTDMLPSVFIDRYIKVSNGIWST